MAPSERHRAAALERSWDALIRGEPVTNPDQADAPLTALAARLQATSAIPTLFPDPERSWRELRVRGAGLVAMHATETRPATWWGPNGQDATTANWQSTRLPRQSPPRWVLSQLATAALLLLALAAGLLVLWQDHVPEQKHPTWLPAEIASSLPAGYAEEILFNATFADDELPDGATEAVFYRVKVPSGAELPYLSARNCLHSSCNKDAVTIGVGAEIVESGAYGVRFDRPFWVQRAGESGAKEEIPAGHDVVLGAGDVLIFHDYLAMGEMRNPEAEPVELLGMAIVDYASGGEPIAMLPSEIAVEQLDVSITSDWEALPDGPVTVTLRRVTLPARTLLPPFGPRGLESIRVEQGAIAWTFAHSAETAEGGLRIHRRAGETAPFAITRNGALRFLESTGDEPADLLVLTIEPAGFGGNPLTP